MNGAVVPSWFAGYVCVDTWLTDSGRPQIDVPTLMVARHCDRILPIDSTARRLPELIADCTIEIDDGPTCTGVRLRTIRPHW
jgi:non-heme chloroperoxidase